MDSNSHTTGLTENIKCFVRCKPLNEKEINIDAGVIKLNEFSNTICIDNKIDLKYNENKPFTFDYVFSENSKQQDIFEKVATPILSSFLQGFNSTIFSYGQTGSGKTHTILGPLESLYEATSDSHGIIPRIFQHIFEKFETFPNELLDNQESNKTGTVQNDEASKNLEKTETVFHNLNLALKCSCIEIYQEQIIDLLSSISEEKLLIREDPKRGMYIEGITEASIETVSSGKELLMIGLKNRHVAATNMNSESSRSHLIFTIFMNMSYTQPDGCILSRNPRLHLIDLAGSERQKSTMAMGGRLREAAMINKSLSTLGNVINALVEVGDGKNKHVPFRDSKLTFFLKDSLGGNSKTTIIANISQSIVQLNETISTLKFVQRAKMIKNKAVVNESVNDTVKNLQIEIKRLKEEITVLYTNIKLNSKNRRSTTSNSVDVEEFLSNNKLLDGGDSNTNSESNVQKRETISKTAKSNESMVNDLKIIRLIEKVENLLKFENKTIQFLNGMKKKITCNNDLDFFSENLSQDNTSSKIRDSEITCTSIPTDNFNMKLFTQSNKEIQNFFEDYFKLKPTSFAEYKLTHVKEIERFSALIEELKRNDENNFNTIDELNSEIFLLNMELTYHKNLNDKKSSPNKQSVENSSYNVSEFHSETPKKSSGNSTTLNENQFETPSEREKIEKDLSENNFEKNSKKISESFELFSAAKSSMGKNQLFSGRNEDDDDYLNRDRSSSSNSVLTSVRKLKENFENILEEKNIEINLKNEEIKDILVSMEIMKNQKVFLENNFDKLKEENENISKSLMNLREEIEKLEYLHLQDLNKLKKSEDDININLEFYLMERKDIDKIFENNEKKLNEFAELYYNEIDLNFKNFITYTKLIDQLKTEERSKIIHTEFLSKNLEEIMSERKEIESNFISTCEENQYLKFENDKLMIDKLKLQNSLDINLEEITEIDLIITQNNSLVESLENNYLTIIDSIRRFHIPVENVIKNLNSIERNLEKSFFSMNLKLEKSEEKIMYMKEKILKFKQSNDKNSEEHSHIEDYNKLFLNDENHKIRLLMKFKKDNYDLKNNMIELKKHNEILQDENFKSSKLQNSIQKLFSKSKNEKFEISTLESDILKIIQEHEEIILQILNLEPYVRFNLNNNFNRQNNFLNQNQSDILKLQEENKFLRCSKILKNVEESLELFRFHSQNKFKNENNISPIECLSGKENISSNRLIEEDKIYLNENTKYSQRKIEEKYKYNTRNLTPIKQNLGRNNNLIDNLCKDTNNSKSIWNAEKIHNIFGAESKQKQI